MTYCLGIKINQGIVMISDSRTNAGVDNVNTYSKMWRFGEPGKRQLVICSAGNLATTQAVIAQIELDIAAASTVNLLNVRSLAEAAAYIGRLNVETQKNNAAAGVNFSSTFLVAGEIYGSKNELYLIYPEGNYIASSSQQPYLQIGETKYGKPILDRVVQCDTQLEQAALCGLVSMDAAMRSNLTVGPPIEVFMLPSGSAEAGQYMFFEEDNSYLRELRMDWNQQMREAFNHLQAIDWQSPA
jgi:putative proteasome-type protease